MFKVDFSSICLFVCLFAVHIFGTVTNTEIWDEFFIGIMCSPKFEGKTHKDHLGVTMCDEWQLLDSDERSLSRRWIRWWKIWRLRWSNWGFERFQFRTSSREVTEVGMSGRVRMICRKLTQAHHKWLAFRTPVRTKANHLPDGTWWGGGRERGGTLTDRSSWGWKRREAAHGATTQHVKFWMGGGMIRNAFMARRKGLELSTALKVWTSGVWFSSAALKIS